MSPFRSFQAEKAAEEAPAFSTLTAQTLYSGVEQMLSSAAFVSQLQLPSWKWKGIQVSPALVFLETCATDSILPRRELTTTRSPSAMPRFAASFVLISMKEWPEISLMPSVLSVIAQAL